MIGVLGFTPLFTSIIYARNALRATRAAGPFLGKQVAIRAMVLSGMFALVVPYVINVATTTQTLSLSSTLSETMD